MCRTTITAATAEEWGQKKHRSIRDNIATRDYVDVARSQAVAAALMQASLASGCKNADTNTARSDAQPNCTKICKRVIQELKRNVYGPIYQLCTSKL